MKRLLYAAACCSIVALLPVTAAAAPTPSPALSGVLAPPPSADYVEADATVPGSLEGAFDAKKYVATGGPANPALAERTLERDGFVDGFARTWIQRSSGHVLVEIVIAFNGADGAKSWLLSSELADKAEPSYQHSVSISGIDAYYGARFHYASNNSYADAYVFVKGNDYFAVIVASAIDDLGTAAATQTRVQYDSAPPYTIPPSAWIHSNTITPRSFGFNAGLTLGAVLIGVLILAALLLVVGVVLRSQRRARSSYAVPPPALLMSTDGRFWWDGSNWRSATNEVPPAAQRSADGRFWWDGATWRRVP
jgi:hypothetical protein